MTYIKHKPETITHPSDLYSIENFQREIDFKNDKSIQLVEIIGSYIFNESDYVKCGIKYCGTLHGKGFLVLTNNNTVTNIGNLCGKKHFGETFKNATVTFKKKVRSIENKEYLEQMKLSIQPHKDELDKLLRTASALSKSGLILNKLAPEQLLKIKKMGKAKDFNIYKETELNFFEFKKAKKQDRNASRYKLEKIGNIYYCDFFSEQVFERIKKEIKKPIDDFEIAQHNLPDLNEKQISELSLNLKKSINNIPSINSLLEKGIKFYSEDNLKNLINMDVDKETLKKLIKTIKETLSKELD